MDFRIESTGNLIEQIVFNGCFLEISCVNIKAFRPVRHEMFSKSFVVRFWHGDVLKMKKAATLLGVAAFRSVPLGVVT